MDFAVSLCLLGSLVLLGRKLLLQAVTQTKPVALEDFLACQNRKHLICPYAQ